MKKIIRYTSLLLCVIMISLCLCSCNALDNARRTHAVYAPGSTDTVYFNGDVYKQLPQCNIFSVSTYNLAYVTEQDVPVLLKEMYGYSCFYSDDFRFINIFDSYYCKENIYNEYVEKFNNYKLDRYYTEVYEFNRETEIYDVKYLPLSDLATETIEEVINNTTPIKNVSLNQSVSQYIYLCDESLEFRSIAYCIVTDNAGDTFLATTPLKDGVEYFDTELFYYELNDDQIKILTLYLTK